MLKFSGRLENEKTEEFNTEVSTNCAQIGFQINFSGFYENIKKNKLLLYFVILYFVKPWERSSTNRRQKNFINVKVA